MANTFSITAATATFWLFFLSFSSSSSYTAFALQNHRRGLVYSSHHGAAHRLSDERAVPLHQERAAPLPSGWQYIGCFSEPSGGRMLANKVASTTSMTQGACVGLCVAAGSTFAGMQYGQECWCGSTLSGASALPDSSCTSKCAGERSSVPFAIICP